MADGRILPLRNWLPSDEDRHAFALAGVVLALGVGLTFASDQFLTWRNLLETLESVAFSGVLAVGLLVVLISGGIDISFAAVASVAQYALAIVLSRVDGGWALAFAVAGGVGLALGIVNGALVHGLRTSPIIVTIATMNLYYGLLVYASGGRWLYDFPDWFVGGVDFLSLPDGAGGLYRVTLQIGVLIASVAGVAALLGGTALGRQIRALGGAPEAARRLGFPIARLHLAVYGLMGLLAGVAGLVQSQLVLSVAPTALVGRELDVLAALVLGGASLDGGKGGVIGTVLGLALVAMVQNGLTLVGVSSYWHQVVIGAVVLVSVTVTAGSKVRSATGATA